MPLLALLVQSFRDFFVDLAPLLSDDVEVDFFNNIVHIQLHRRRRALTRMIGLATQGKLGASAATHVLVMVNISNSYIS